jgi:hypothetical protein
MSFFQLAAVVVVAAGALGAVACGDSGAENGPGAAPNDSGAEPNGSDADPNEPDVEPAVGGESSDFGGTPSPCVQFEQLTLTDEDGAAALGFDVRALVSRVERDFDEPLRWMPGGATYAALSVPSPPPTRVQGRTRIRSLFYARLDPESCDGTSCRFGPVSLECPDRLDLRLEVELRTLDGIIDATAIGYAFQGRPGSSFELPAGTVFIGLPDIPDTRPLSWLEFIELGDTNENASLRFNDERIDGDVHTRGPAPLWGHWPDDEAR